MSNEIQKTGANAPTKWQQALINSEGKFLAIVGNEATTKKELGFAAQILEGSAQLKACDPSSICNAVINVARTSITLNPVMKLAYLIPRGGKCVLDFSYIGLIKMLKDYGVVKFIDAFVVYEDENEAGKFKIDNLENKIFHEPIIAKSLEEQSKRKIYGAYTRSILNDGTVVFGQFMAWREIEKRQQKSESRNSQYSPWQNWLEDMVKKTVIRRDFKFLIAGNPDEKLQAAIQIEDENNPLESSNGHVKKTTNVVFMEDVEVMEEEPGNEPPTTETVAETVPEVKPEPETEKVKPETEKDKVKDEKGSTKQRKLDLE